MGLQFKKTFMNLCSDEDISSGLIINDRFVNGINKFREATLYLKANDAVDITVKVKVDDNWYSVNDSPVSFSSAGDKIVSLPAGSDIEISGSNITGVTAELVAIY